MPVSASRVVTQIRDDDDFAGALTDGYFLSYDLGTDKFTLAPVVTTVALDDLTDVTLTGVAQGDILYRGVSQWVNLGPGTSGQFLKTQGAAANPVWDTVTSPSIGGGISGGTVGSVLFVGTGPVFGQDNTNFFWNDTDNSLILAATPPADATKASLRLGAALVGGDADGTFLGINAPNAYAGEFWRCQVNGTTLASLNASSNTQLGIGPGAESVTVPGSATALVLSSTTGDRCSFYWKQGSSTCTMFLYADGSLYIDNDVVGSTVNWRGAGASTRVVFGDSPSMQIFTTATTNKALTLMVAVGQSAPMFQVLSGVTALAEIGPAGASLFRPLDAATNAVTIAQTLGHSTSGTPAAGFGGEQRMTLQSSTTLGRSAAGLSWEWATATDATRKARGKLLVYDTAVREALRFEADGSNPMLGFLGASAVTRQTISGSRGGNAALASLLTGLANLGLITDSTSA